MPVFGTLQDFLDLWPLWLVIGAVGALVFLARDSEPKQPIDPLSQQMKDQQRVNSSFNFGAMFGNRD